MCLLHCGVNTFIGRHQRRFFNPVINSYGFGSSISYLPFAVLQAKGKIYLAHIVAPTPRHYCGNAVKQAFFNIGPR